MLNRYGAMIELGEIMMGRAQLLPGLDRDMGDDDTMFVPQRFDLPLAGVEKMVQIVDKEHPLPRCMRRTAAPKQNVIGILGRREKVTETAFRDDPETAESHWLEGSGVHGDIWDPSG